MCQGLLTSRRGFAKAILGNYVEVGANTVIEQGQDTDTQIRENTIIGPLVCVGHDTQIGKHCLVVAQCGLGNSVRLEDHATLLGQVGVISGATVGTAAIVGPKSGVHKSVPANAYYFGIPTRPKFNALRENRCLAQKRKKQNNQYKGDNHESKTIRSI